MDKLSPTVSMADNDEILPKDEEELAQKHRKEKKELQAKIQALKKTAIKGDKKKKKEVHEEITKLENDLQAKHTTELAEFKSKTPEIAETTEEIKELTLEEPAPASNNKVSKAQKRRNKKDQVNKEREQRIAEQEIENESGERNLEIQKIKEKLKKKDLMIFEIPSDGDCLFAAVDRGLSSRIGVPLLRTRVSNYITSHPNEYLPFLCDPNTGEQFTQEQFANYCKNVATTKQWGGQVELDAIAHVVERAIVVVQAEGPDLVMGGEYDDSNAVTVTYHRHMYRLGEHYNSVQAYVEDPEI